MVDVILDESELFINLTSSVCGYTEETGLVRFVLITLSSLLATIGAGANLVLAHVFIFRSIPGTPPTLYPMVLAILDTLICTFYVLFFGIDVIMNYLRIEVLFIAYHTYILPLFVFSKCVQLGIPYMLMFVTLERYAWICHDKRISTLCLFTSKFGRVVSILVCCIFCILLRLPSAFALTVEVFPECQDFFRSLAVSYHQWAQESQLFKWYDFHLVSICQVLFPFLVLVFLNSIIVIRLSAIDRLNKNCHVDLKISNEDGGSFRALKRALRRPITSVAVKNAVQTTVIIVTTYLICSGLHLVLTILERMDSDLLKSEDDSTKASNFYTAVGDTISFLYMFTSAIRILIYYKCNAAIRISIKRTLNFWPRTREFNKLNVPIVTTSQDVDNMSFASIRI